MLGRPPKPTELHIAQGTFRKHRHGGKDSGTQAGVPKPPAWLTDVYEDEADKKAIKGLWRHYADLLTDRGVLTTDNGAALALLCQVTFRHQKTAAKVDRLAEPYYETTTAQGDVKYVTHPLVTQLQQLTRELRTQLQSWGLDATSRHKASKVEAPKPNSKWDTLKRVSSMPDAS